MTPATLRHTLDLADEAKEQGGAEQWQQAGGDQDWGVGEVIHHETRGLSEEDRAAPAVWATTAARSSASARRLWNALERQHFPFLSLSGRATTAPCVEKAPRGENATRRIKR